MWNIVGGSLEIIRALCQKRLWNVTANKKWTKRHHWDFCCKLPGSRQDLHCSHREMFRFNMDDFVFPRNQTETVTVRLLCTSLLFHRTKCCTVHVDVSMTGVLNSLLGSANKYLKQLLQTIYIHCFFGHLGAAQRGVSSTLIYHHIVSYNSSDRIRH